MRENFDNENFAKEIFFMFLCNKVTVYLICDNSLTKTIIDRFGKDVTTLAYDITPFRAQTKVSTSPIFFGWVFGFNGKVRIFSSENMKEQYKQMIAQAINDVEKVAHRLRM